MRAATASMTLSESVAYVNEASGLIAHYREERDGRERIENLEELVNAAELFVREADLAVDAPIARSTQDAPDDALAEGATDPLTAFLAHAALEAGDTQAAEGRPALQLMTVHSAKGLEFHTVFVTGLEEGLFPHENSLNEADGVEEERRLMYVAVTRARRRLYLTHAQTRMLHGQTRYNIPSRFLSEVPRALLEWLSPPRRRGIDIDRAERQAREVRSGCHHRRRGPRRRRPRASQFSRRRRQMACARIREAGTRLELTARSARASRQNETRRGSSRNRRCAAWPRSIVRTAASARAPAGARPAPEPKAR